MRRLTSMLCADCSVAKLGICASLGEDILTETARVTVTHDFRKSERVSFGEGAGPAMLIVRRGCVMIALEMSDGRHQILDLLTQGDVLLDMASEDPLGLYVRAATDAEVCRIPTNMLDQLFERSPELAQAIFRAMMKELRRKNSQLAMLGQKRSEERIATLLLDLASRAVGRERVENRVHLPLSRGEIGELLCLTKETVSRSFTYLRDERLIETPRPHDVIILDREGLFELAEGNRRAALRR